MNLFKTFSDYFQHSSIQKRYSVASLFLYIFPVCFIGLPLWWMTTRVFKAGLPIYATDDFPPLFLNFTLTMEIVSASKRFTLHNYSEILNTLQVWRNAHFVQTDNITHIRKLAIIHNDSFVFYVCDSLCNTFDLHDNNARELFVSPDDVLSSVKMVQRAYSLKNDGPSNGKPAFREMTIVLSIAVDESERKIMDWSYLHEIEAYLKAYLKHFTDLKFKYISQVISYNDLIPISAKSNFVVLTNKKLAAISNYFSSRSQCSLDYCINLVVFIPSTRFEKINFSQIPRRTFYVKSWGAIYFSEHNLTNFLQASASNLQVISNFIAVLNEIFDVDQELFSKYFVSRITMDRWRIEQTAKNYRLAVESVQSLYDLRNKVKNMVIKDHVASKIADAFKALKVCQIHFNSNDFELSFNSCYEARMLADKAFFDQSLLELLYFPDDQKIGVYLPLFFPILGSLAIALIKECKEGFDYARKKKID